MLVLYWLIKLLKLLVLIKGKKIDIGISWISRLDLDLIMLLFNINNYTIENRCL